jgi:Common central domain of tyrosinase/Polyphenol oxidase middle domain
MSNPGLRDIAVSRPGSQSNATGRLAQGGFLRRSIIGIRRYSPVLLGLIGFGFFSRPAVAQTSYPLYCQGSLTTSAPTPAPTGPTTTPFIWASTGAGAQAPGPGQCAWADRAASGAELVNGNGNVICDNVGLIASVPAGQYWEFGVYRNQMANNCMRITQYVGIVSPPFSATPELPPTETPPSYPLYCMGPVATGPPTPPPSGPTWTPFVWSATGAGAQSPGAGQCAWADRPAGGVEIQNGNGNSICDWSGLVNGVPAGQYFEFGVYRDALHNNCMRVTRVIGVVSPPFSAVPALPPYVRQSVASLSAQQIASLQRGIGAMMNLNPVYATSYRFQANIHGTYDSATSPREASAWNLCEHGSYFFFSWHRMYLYFFERILRAASGDPNLALPYWNWSDPTQRALPQAFWQPATNNPLYIPPPERPTAVDNGTYQLSAGTVDSSVAFTYTNFDSPANSGLSFGGQIASPTQFNAPHGEFESQPHDVVHGSLAGLMGDPDTAAEDPIFWLHHANIDRLWNQWIAQGGRQDPTDSAWLNTTFTFFDENGTAVNMTGQQVVDTATQLGYRYDDDPPAPLPGPSPMHRLRPEGQPGQVKRTPLTRPSPENAPRHMLDEKVSHASVPLLSNAEEILESGLKPVTSHRVVLQITDIQYERSPGVYYEVYLDLPPGTPQSPKSPYFIGNLSFFALMPHHGTPNASAGVGGGGKRDFDVTKVVSMLRREKQKWNSSEVSVTFVPTTGLVDKQGRPVAVELGKKASFAVITLSLE